MPSQENKLILWIIGFKLKEHSCRFLTAWGSEYLRKPTLSRLICSEPEVPWQQRLLSILLFGEELERLKCFRTYGSLYSSSYMADAALHSSEISQSVM